MLFGRDDFGYSSNEVWEYNPGENLWIEKSNFPGTPRAGAGSFVIGDRAYIIGGYQNITDYFIDVWEYDNSSDTWTEKITSREWAGILLSHL